MTAEQDLIGVSELPAAGLQVRALDIEPVGSQSDEVHWLCVCDTRRHVAVCLGSAFVLIGCAVGILIMEFQAAKGRRAIVDHVVMTSRSEGTDKLPAAGHVAPAGPERIDSAVEKAGCA